jgi:hypothetical protein
MDPTTERPREIEVRNYTYPGGITYVAPDSQLGFWRTGEGKRVSLGEVIAGADDEAKARVLEANRRAIGEIIAAANVAKLDGDGATAQRQIAAARRLCAEIGNQFPAMSWAPAS